MTLEPGQTLLHYRLVEAIGEGGMGVVWRATDTVLGRDVALKVLPGIFAEDPERRTRFEREARLLATLNHPNIATIHGLHACDGIHFLVMELIPGRDLSQVLAQGAPVLEESLRIAREIARALEAAHAKGIIHRDLKPANVKLTAEGDVRVLDFGLAKAFEATTAAAAANPTLSPTATSAGTLAGMILGTAAYMSPEQARGEPADRRSDVWAFGCVLFELVTGRRLFHATSVSETLAAVLRADPNWNALPERTPPAIRRLLRRCLTRDPARRLHDIADARLEIEDALDPAMQTESHAGSGGAGGIGRRSVRLPWMLAVLFALAAIAAVTAIVLRPAAESGDSRHLSITFPGLELSPGATGDMVVALAPDGRSVAFTARDEDSPSLHLRRLDDSRPVPLPGTDGASSPFFSADGQWIAYFARGKLWKTSVDGGTPIELADAPSARGGDFLADGSVVFAPAFNSGLLRVESRGGAPAALTEPDRANGERTHRWPAVLPGGKAVLFTIGTQDNPGNYENATIAAVDLETRKIVKLVQGGSIARYSPSGHLVYSRGGALIAVPFDARRLEITGAPATVLEDVLGESTSGAVHFGIARDGTLMVVPGRPFEGARQLVFVSRSGDVRRVTRIEGIVTFLDLSPDETQVALCIGRGPGDGDVYLLDLRRPAPTRLTFHQSAIGARWAPDGLRLAYGVTQGGRTGVFSKRADGSDEEELLVREADSRGPVFDGWIPASDSFVYTVVGGAGGMDLKRGTRGSDRSEDWLAGDAAECCFSPSPDGRWAVYASDESGRFEIYVRRIDGSGRWQITSDGGQGPIWSKDGTEIFFTRGQRVFAVPVETAPSFAPGEPVELFRYDFERLGSPWTNFDVSNDGQRFLMVERAFDTPVPRQIDVISGFASRLER